MAWRGWIWSSSSRLFWRPSDFSLREPERKRTQRNYVSGKGSRAMAATKKTGKKKPRQTIRKTAPRRAAAKKLQKYQSMRDFSVTAEPSGRHAVAAGQALRYVIQKHAATRLHYDFRLEWAGTFKSWAVTRGPSLDPADKRLAVEVEDHPLD